VNRWELRFHGSSAPSIAWDAVHNCRHTLEKFINLSLALRDKLCAHEISGTLACLAMITNFPSFYVMENDNFDKERRITMYDPNIVQPMRDEVNENWIKRSPPSLEVDAALKNQRGRPSFPAHGRNSGGITFTNLLGSSPVGQDMLPRGLPVKMHTWRSIRR